LTNTARARISARTATLILSAVCVACTSDATSGVDCPSTRRTPTCDLPRTTPGHTVPGLNDGATSSNGPRTNATTHCFYERVQPQAPAPSGAGPGAWHVQTCVSQGRVASQSQPRWMSDGQARGTPPPGPSVCIGPSGSVSPSMWWLPAEQEVGIGGMPIVAAHTRHRAWRYGEGTSSPPAGQPTDTVSGATTPLPPPVAILVRHVPLATVPGTTVVIRAQVQIETGTMPVQAAARTGHPAVWRISAVAVPGRSVPRSSDLSVPRFGVGGGGTC
jgi:hypothetical protein